MSRHDAIVLVRSADNHGGVGDRLYVVDGREMQQEIEVLLNVAAAVVRLPVRGGREKMVAEHIGDRGLSKDSAKQVRPLVGGSGRDQPTVASAFDRRMLFISVARLLQELSHCDHIVDRMRPLVHIAAEVPLETELATTANVRLDPHAL